MQCALKATLQSAWWKIQHLISTHKTTDYPPPDLGNTSHTNGPNGDDNEKQQITLTQYGNCSMEGKGGLETAQKNLALSRFRIQLKATPPALSLLHVFVLAARCLWRCQILVLNNCHVYQNTIALFFFLLLIAIQQAWHQGHCMWQVLQQATVAGPVHEVGQPESLGYQSNVP